MPLLLPSKAVGEVVAVGLGAALPEPAPLLALLVPVALGLLLLVGRASVGLGEGETVAEAVGAAPLPVALVQAVFVAQAEAAEESVPLPVAVAAAVLVPPTSTPSGLLLPELLVAGDGVKLPVVEGLGVEEALPCPPPPRDTVMEAVTLEAREGVPPPALAEPAPPAPLVPVPALLRVTLGEAEAEAERLELRELEAVTEPLPPAWLDEGVAALLPVVHSTVLVVLREKL